MASEQIVTDRDRELWKQIGGDPDDLHAKAGDETIELPHGAWKQLLEDVAELKQWKHTIDQRIQNGGLEELQDNPAIYHYSNIPAGEREELLSTSEQIAVTLHDHWDDVAWDLGTSRNRKIGCDTRTKANAKYQPSQLKYRLKQLLDAEFEAHQLHRGMRSLAELSGGDESVDEYSRVHITGGEYEYHHRPTPDGQETFHVVFEATE